MTTVRPNIDQADPHATYDARFRAVIGAIATERRFQAAAYVWGRQDAGDDKLRTACVETHYSAYDPAWMFANFASGEANDYAEGRRTNLQPIREQYDRFLNALHQGWVQDS